MLSVYPDTLYYRYFGHVARRYRLRPTSWWLCNQRGDPLERLTRP